MLKKMNMLHVSYFAKCILKKHKTLNKYKVVYFLLSSTQ